MRKKSSNEKNPIMLILVLLVLIVKMIIWNKKQNKQKRIKFKTTLSISLRSKIIQNKNLEVGTQIIQIAVKMLKSAVYKKISKIFLSTFFYIKMYRPNYINYSKTILFNHKGQENDMVCMSQL